MLANINSKNVTKDSIFFSLFIIRAHVSCRPLKIFGSNKTSTHRHYKASTEDKARRKRQTKSKETYKGERAARSSHWNRDGNAELLQETVKGSEVNFKAIISRQTKSDSHSVCV